MDFCIQKCREARHLHLPACLDSTDFTPNFGQDQSRRNDFLIFSGIGTTRFILQIEKLIEIGYNLLKEFTRRRDGVV